MGYAAVSRVLTAPTPADSGTVLRVEVDTGDRYPTPPFTYLAWPTQTIPSLGVDSEEGTCTSIDGDYLVIERPDNAVAITSGMSLSALRTLPLYNLEESISLSKDFPALDTGVALQLRTPGGAIGRYTDALTEAVADDGGSAYSLVFEANEGGRWFYVFTSDQRVTPEQDFYVRYSEVY